MVGGIDTGHGSTREDPRVDGNSGPVHKTVAVDSEGVAVPHSRWSGSHS